MKKEKTPEAYFDVRLTVKASLLGTLLATLDGKYDIHGVRLIKDMEPGRNHPKGTMREMIHELLQANKGRMHHKELKQRLVENGFTKGSVATQVRRYVKDKEFKQLAGGDITL